MISKAVLDYFASDPLEPHFAVDEVARAHVHILSTELEAQLETYDVHEVESAFEDKLFRVIHGGLPPAEQEREARIWTLRRDLEVEIPKLRLALLRRQSESTRPRPYDHPALVDVPLSPEYLVPLSLFRIDGGGLSKDGFTFTITPSLEAVNAQWWLIRNIVRHELIDRTWVRLDPLIVRPESEFQSLHYKMLVYRQPLNWSEIENARDEIHGRWMLHPDSLSSEAQFTDFVWSRRDDEIHFRLEELPQQRGVETRGSRYFHTIYRPEDCQVIHMDGAIRIYDDAEWQQRSKLHVRSAGKAGTRVKLFRIDGNLDRDVIGDICGSFFVWNDDVARYFGGT